MNRVKKLYLENPIFKFMASYSAVLLVPLIICMAGYQVSFKIVEKDIKDTNLAMISHSKSMIDSQIQALNALVMQVATNPTITSIVETKSTEDKTFYYEVDKAIELLSTMVRHANLNLIEDLYIYLEHVNYVMTPMTLYKADFYYEHLLLKDKALYSDWTKFLISEKNNDKYLINENQLEYVQVIPVKFNTPASGTIVVEFNEQEILKFFDAIAIEQGCYMYIEDEEGNMVMQLSQGEGIPARIDFTDVKGNQGIVEQNINNEKMISVYTVSEVNGWRYTLVLPERVIMKELLELKQFTGLLFGVTAIIGLFICYYMATKNGKPLNEVIKYLKESLLVSDMEQDVDNIDNLGGTISKILSKSQDLQEELEKQQPFLETAFFQKLIRGEFTGEKEIELIASSINLTIESDKYVIVNYRVFANNDFYTIDTQTLNEVKVTLVLIKNMLKQNIHNKMYFYDVDYLTTAVIIELNHGQDILGQIENVNKLIAKEYHVTPAWGISNEFTSLLEVWRGYEQARKALKKGIEIEGQSILCYNEIVESTNQYYYPTAFEQRLITYAKGTEITNLSYLFEVLYTENFEKRNLQEETRKKLCTEINSTVTKIAGPDNYAKHQEELEQLEELMKLGDTASIDRYFRKLYDIYIELSNDFKRSKSQSQTKLSNKIIEYINEVYVDPNLGLGMIASKFNISEGYVSSLFKEQTGINFAEYVESYRIKKACELLMDTSLNINDIGQQIGYNSVQSFRRAFKRIHGISPSELRKKK